MKSAVFAALCSSSVSATVGPAWTYGAAEAPAGTKNLEGFEVASYTGEQQMRLGVDEDGAKLAVPFNAALENALANNGTMVTHGLLGDTHCEEIYVPKAEYTKFLANPHETPYKSYHHGLCKAPFTSYDGNRADGAFPDVTHVKRGVGSGASPTLTLTNCDTNSAVNMKWTHGGLTKGNSVTITGTGTASSPLSTSGVIFGINAQYGNGPSPVPLLNEQQSNCGTISKTLPLFIGTVTGTSCANANTITASATIPVPNLGGVVIAAMRGGTNQRSFYCVSMQMNL